MAGSGITVVPNSASFGGAAVAKGIFGNGFDADLPLDKGVILSSGDIALAKGPNGSSRAAKDNYPAAGDADLDNLLGASVTLDAAVLEFDVISAVATNLAFEYIFASEEYPEFSGSQYNDIVAIFIDGVNVATVPGTSQYDAVNTVNGGCVDPSYPAVNPEYYVDNDDPERSALPEYAASSPVYDLQYDGFTVLLTAQTNLSANVTYHIKIAIADAVDSDYDSTVFIKANVPCP